MRKFIWSSKKPKISMQRMQRNIDSGGLGLLDLKLKDASIKFGIFIRLIKSKSELKTNRKDEWCTN